MAWNKPIIIASLKVISLSFFVPLEFITNSKANPVIKNPIPTKKMFLDKSVSK